MRDPLESLYSRPLISDTIERSRRGIDGVPMVNMERSNFWTYAVPWTSNIAPEGSRFPSPRDTPDGASASPPSFDIRRSADRYLAHAFTLRYAHGM